MLVQPYIQLQAGMQLQLIPPFAAMCCVKFQQAAASIAEQHQRRQELSLEALLHQLSALDCQQGHTASIKNWSDDAPFHFGSLSGKSCPISGSDSAPRIASAAYTYLSKLCC